MTGGCHAHLLPVDDSDLVQTVKIGHEYGQIFAKKDGMRFLGHRLDFCYELLADLQGKTLIFM